MKRFAIVAFLIASTAIATAEQAKQPADKGTNVNVEILSQLLKINETLSKMALDGSLHRGQLVFFDVIEPVGDPQALCQKLAGEGNAVSVAGYIAPRTNQVFEKGKLGCRF